MNVAFDSNIYLSYPNLLFDARTYLSSIVLTELLSGAQDATRIKELKLWRQMALKFDHFLVPDAEDWLQTGLALQRLSQQSKRANFGSTPKISAEERVRLFNDCLLAVSCRRAGVVVVTDNIKDFERLSSVCRVKFQGGDEFFAPASP